jgi:sulfur carrier protein ThiS
MESAETKTIEVAVNGQPKRVPAGLNVTGLLAALGVEG